jgi:hypothetical protein
MSATSSSKADTCHPINAPIAAIKRSKPSRQMKTANPRGTFLLSIHLEKGRKSVANMPAIEIGIKNSLAKYNPAVIKKMRRSFFIKG